VRTATLVTNPTEHITEGEDLIFEEVEVLHVDKTRKRVLISSENWRNVRNWGPDRRNSVGWIWVFFSMEDAIKGVNKWKDKYKNGL